jgi:hypothetical protein
MLKLTSRGEDRIHVIKSDRSNMRAGITESGGGSSWRRGVIGGMGLVALTLTAWVAAVDRCRECRNGVESCWLVTFAKCLNFDRICHRSILLFPREPLLVLVRFRSLKPYLRVPRGFEGISTYLATR